MSDHHITEFRAILNRDAIKAQALARQATAAQEHGARWKSTRTMNPIEGWAYWVRRTYPGGTCLLPVLCRWVRGGWEVLWGTLETETGNAGLDIWD